MNTIEYEADMGRAKLTAEMLMALNGLSLEEQAQLYVVETVRVASGGEGATSRSDFSPLEKSYAVKNVIVHNGVIVGVEFMGRFGRVYGFPDEFCNIEHSTYCDEKNTQTHTTDCVLRWKESIAG